MRFIINFQIKIDDDIAADEIIRSSYTILEKDCQKYKLSDITKVEDWFKSFFKKTPLDHFIDTTKLSKNTNFDMKIGRITNAISGEYKTF